MSTIKTMAELKSVISDKKITYDLEPGTTFVVDEFLNIPTSAMVADVYYFNGNGCIIDVSNLDRGIQFGGRFVVTNCIFFSRGTKKMFDETKPELGSVHFSRVAVKGECEFRNCTFNVRDKLGLDIGGRKTVTSSNFIDTSVYVEGNNISFVNNVIDGGIVVICGNGGVVTGNEFKYSNLFIGNKKGAISNNNLVTTNVSTTCYTKYTQSANHVELASFSNNVCDYATLNIYEGDLSTMNVGMEIKNNISNSFVVNIYAGGLASKHDFFYVANPPELIPQTTGKAISIIGNTGLMSDYRFYASLKSLEIKDNELNQISFSSGLSFERVSLVGNKGRVHFDDNLTPMNSLSINFSGVVKELFIKDNNIALDKALPNTTIDTSGCDVVVISNNSLFNINYPLLESNGKIKIVKDNIIHSNLEKPIGLEDSTSPKDQLLHNIVIKKIQ